MAKFEYSQAIDQKWQQKWKESNIYRFDEAKTDKKLYLLEMFSYPSGKNLHIGHWWNYSLPDSYGRMKRMQGYEVFHPIGFDAFGLPAENYAIKTGVHPEDSTLDNIATMEKQFQNIGATYDWNYEVVTCKPDYYQWTQWLFLKLYENGLSYRKEAPVNWCPSCKTVLANEQVVGGRCERCDSEVVRKNMTQWFFKITDYAEELLTGLEKLDWPQKTKKIQENWIGKSVGCDVDFMTENNECIPVFTTRADTLMGVTYLVLAPEHPLIKKITAPEYKAEVERYQSDAAKQSEIERSSTVREKTGVFTGAYAIHPITKDKIPIWISDYVVMSYGTGAVMAVPAHDERDYDFAVKFHLPIKTVIQNNDVKNTNTPFCEDGILVNSSSYTGLASKEARKRISSDLEQMQLGGISVKYRLRDWLVSRQRYWGAPIPVIYCEHCGTVPVPEKDLPVKLPHNVAFLPNGQSPLASCPEFVNTVCPVCGRPARRETDTLDTFVCSSWYYLRFFDNRNDEEPFNTEKINRIMPVDKYIGGVEHAAMHLLYARFITKALRDMGYLDFDEPFSSLVHQGVILGSDGQKMSKRKGAVPPDDYIRQYGSDVFRLYLGFGFSYRDGGPWNDEGIKAMARFVAKVARIVENHLAGREQLHKNDSAEKESLEYTRHYTIRQVTLDIDNFQFNTAIARIMEFTTAVSKYQTDSSRRFYYEEAVIKDLLLLLAPLAPHFAEEMWEAMGYEYSIHNHSWPEWDESKLVQPNITIAVQINGTVRAVISVPSDADSGQLKDYALKNNRIFSLVKDREIKQVIVAKGRIINIVI